jgi:hypothetical protein
MIASHRRAYARVAMTTTRKERREQERVAAKAAKKALPLYDDTPARRAIRERVAGALATGTTLPSLLASAHRESDAVGARAFAQTKQPACVAGCAYCCKLYVSVRASEARALAAALRRLDAAQLEDVKRRLAENVTRVRGHSSATYPKPECALLTAAKTCIAYDARPFSCREYHSYDVRACAKADTGEGSGVPSNRIAFAAQRDVALAFTEAAATAREDAVTYELQQALDLLLRDPKADLSPAREIAAP